MDDYSKVKDKKGKPAMHLALWKAVKWVVMVREYGLKKYPDCDNWKKVESIDWYDACLRHLIKYGQGEEIDTESGLPHLAHALCDISYLCEGTLDDVETYNKEKNNE